MVKCRKFLLVLNTPQNVFQIESGSALRSNMLIKALTGMGCVDIICFSRSDLVSNIPNCNVIFSEAIWDEKDFKEVLCSLFRMTVRPSDPYSYFQVNKQKASIVDSFVNQTDYDFIVCRYVQTAIICGLLAYKDKLVIDADDNLSVVRRFQAIQTHSFLYRWKRQYESKRIRIMLKSLLSGIHCSFCSNPLELPSPKTVFLHNTTILKQPVADLSNDSVPRILFIGYLRYFPNQHGIAHFVKTIFPRIRERIPAVELHVVGDGDPEFLTYLNARDGVRAVGIVDDLVSEYQKATVVVIPIYYGSGTCVKFAEALLMNRPIISTPVGARWYSEVCRDGEDYMLANDDDEFIRKTLTLLTSLSSAREMAHRGYDIGEKWFSQKRFVDIVKNAILSS